MTNLMSRYVLTMVVLGACSSSAQQGPPRTATAPPTTPAPAPTVPPTQTQQAPKGSNVSPDAGLLADFKQRVDEYMKLHKKAENAAPTELERKTKPAEIVTAETSLAQHIRHVRANARRGDIFTPATQAMFKRLLQPALAKGTAGKDNKAIIKDDAPQPKEVQFRVNGDYPKQAPLSTVPPAVLLALPPLPEDVQYRFVGKHLILYDAKANLIIDYMLNAMP